MLRELAPAGRRAARRRPGGAPGGAGRGGSPRRPTPRAAQAIDFAFFTELAQAAGNLVFVLILNAIRDALLRARRARAGDRRPRRARAAVRAHRRRREAGDGDRAAAAAFALAGLQRERVEAILR